MTYTEATSNQSFVVREILDLASQAAQDRDWLQVSHYLQQLPEKRPSRVRVLLLSKANSKVAFKLALEILFKADFEHKWEITKFIPSLGTSTIEPLTALLLDETVEAEIRWFICQILGSFAEPEVVLTLVLLLQQTTDEELIAIAGKTLINVGDEAIEVLVNLSAQPEHRFLAVKSLCYIRTAATIEPLMKIAGSQEPELRAMTIEALGSFHDRRIPPILIDALNDVASNVRREAAIALGFRSDLCQELNLVSHLQPLLYDFKLEVCRQAAVSLGRMRQPAADLALFSTLKAETTPMELKVNIIKALSWSNTSAAIDYLQQALLNQNELLKQEIVTHLGRIADDDLKLQAAKALVDLEQNKQLSATSKQALATSLGELRCSCAQATLEKLATDSDRKVQLHAQAALKKLKQAEK